jgi:hypothetical protein
MDTQKTLLPTEPAPDAGELQRLVDALFASTKHATRIDALVLAQAFDLSSDLMSVVERLPPGRMNRAQLAEQLNCTLTARGWGRYYGIVS